MPHTDKPLPGIQDDTRVPVTLLTGFLGAGKTTLLNEILKEPATGPVAVIVNEFGETGLDHELIEALDSDAGIQLMESGCLCCSLRGDLADTFRKLFAACEKDGLVFDRVVIETTGLADPGPIMQTLLVDRFLAARTRLDGIVTVADAISGPTTLKTRFEAVSQIALADLVILGKTDLVTEQDASNFADHLQSLNPTADIVRKSNSGVGPTRLWALTGMRTDASPQEVVAWTLPKVRQDALGNLTGMGLPAPDRPVTTAAFSRHDTDITSISIVLDAPLEDTVFDAWFDTLITFKGSDILRVKGILFLRGIDTPFAFHGVQSIFDPPVPLANWTGEDTRSRIILIGRNLNHTEIQRSLDLLHLGQPHSHTRHLETQYHD